jgi:hypothetical protein
VLQVVIFGGHIDTWDVTHGSMDDGGGVMIAWQVRIILALTMLKGFKNSVFSQHFEAPRNCNFRCVYSSHNLQIRIVSFKVCRTWISNEVYSINACCRNYK